MSNTRFFRRTIVPVATILALALLVNSAPAVRSQDSDIELRAKVLTAMKEGCRFLDNSQSADGYWSPQGNLASYRIGITAMAILALSNCERPPNDPTVRAGLQYLRSLPSDSPTGIYEVSLVIMALAAANEPDRDMGQITRLARALEASQWTEGEEAGLWSYGIKGSNDFFRGRDRSNGQFAVLALRDAAQYGVETDPEVWRRIHRHWSTYQNGDGGWGYKTRGDSSIGSMTAAGISTLAISSRMILDDSDVDARGQPDCCRRLPPDDSLRRGIEWIGQRFTVQRNPEGGNWHFYFLYGMERAGRLSNERFFGQYDWYREGARYLTRVQKAHGEWEATGGASPEKDMVLNTSMALLYLSKGLSRVVVNKLEYGSTAPGNPTRVSSSDWNNHPYDVVNLIDLVSGLPRWPKLLTSQVVNVHKLKPTTAVAELNQAPVLFLSGQEAPDLSDRQVEWIREYLEQGGFLFAVANCGSKEFDEGFHTLMSRMFPRNTAQLRRLPGDHPVFRSEYSLDPRSVELHGVNFGCRTAVIYSPVDIACLWQKWKRHDPPDRGRELKQRILRDTRIGVNVLAYATGREPPVKLHEGTNRKTQPGRENLQRGLIEIARLRHEGGWDTAPNAVGNLLRALDETIGIPVASRSPGIPATLDEASNYPLIFMHGRFRFSLDAQEREALKQYLDRGGVLFADACCGSKQFDRGFRDLIEQMYPEGLEQIPVDHELFSDVLGGHAITETRRKKLLVADERATLESRVEAGPPFLEGVKIDGRYAVIYSKYDISCALEQQASLACDGYVEADAMRLAVNVVLYAMLQDVSWSGRIADPRELKKFEEALPPVESARDALPELVPIPEPDAAFGPYRPFQDH